MGRVKRKADPRPHSDSTTSRPPWASTSPRLIHSPSPEPVGFDLTPTGAKEISDGARPCA